MKEPYSDGSRAVPTPSGPSKTSSPIKNELDRSRYCRVHAASALTIGEEDEPQDRPISSAVVIGQTGTQYLVKLRSPFVDRISKCDCGRAWEYMIPCSHVIAFIRSEGYNPQDWIEWCYSSEALRLTYAMPYTAIAIPAELHEDPYYVGPAVKPGYGRKKSKRGEKGQGGGKRVAKGRRKCGELQANYLVMYIIIIAYLIAYLSLMYHYTFTLRPPRSAPTFLGIGLQVLLTFAFLDLSWTSRSSEE
ncbi:hypothetical protein BCR35DRAFT_331674 [Leucosporidium creatinivorum]|uniref:SWIM-type domain-containing protein n=1 Tax=Leucosporidium creatinivorum TaxID=106004 RepID=A0A1Y2FCX6_9BASI|nr:hypothetical protein BCR35DRAFT_331674 [Leucosporidium creatinivorum]